jgi:hypothetical protein
LLKVLADSTFEAVGGTVRLIDAQHRLDKISQFSEIDYN